MPPDPLSYNISDVNPHLTQCEPPPYLKAGSAPAFVNLATFQNSAKTGVASKLNLSKCKLYKLGCLTTYGLG